MLRGAARGDVSQRARFAPLSFAEDDAQAKSDALFGALDFVPQSTTPMMVPPSFSFGVGNSGDAQSSVSSLILNDLLQDRSTQRIVTEPGSRASPVTVNTLSDLVNLLHSKEHVWEFAVWLGAVLKDRRVKQTYRFDEDRIDIDLDALSRWSDVLGQKLDSDTLNLLTRCASYLGEGAFNIVGKACLPDSGCKDDCVAVKISKLKNFDFRRSTVEFRIQDLLSKTPLLNVFVPKIYQHSLIDYPIIGKASPKVVQTMEIITPWTDPDLHATVTSLDDLVSKVKEFVRHAGDGDGADSDRKTKIQRLSDRLEYIFARIVEFFVVASIQFPGLRHNDLHVGNVLLTDETATSLDGSLAWEAFRESSPGLVVPRVVLSDWEFADIPDVVENGTIRQSRIAVERRDGSIVHWAGVRDGWMLRETRSIAEMERMGRVPYQCDMADILRVVESYRHVPPSVPMPRFRLFNEIAVESARRLASTVSPDHGVWKCHWQWAIRSMQEETTLPTMTVAFLHAFLGASSMDDLRGIDRVLPYDIRVLLEARTLYGRSSDYWYRGLSDKERDVFMLVPLR